MVTIAVKVSEACSSQELEEGVNADLQGFAQYFCETLKNDSLSDSEKAIIKTYLWWKTHPEVSSG